MSDWTFGRKIAAGFAAIVILTATGGITAILSLRSVIASKDRVINGAARDLVEAETLRADSARKQAASRAFLLTGNEKFLDALNTLRSDFDASLKAANDNVTTDEERRLLQEVQRANEEHRVANDQTLNLRRSTPVAQDAAARRWDDEVAPRAERVQRALTAFTDHERRVLEAANAEAAAHARTANWIIGGILLLTVLVAAAAAVLLTRTLTSQIGSSVSQVQGSSAELQAAANQQATGAREHATAMSEIATTVNELLATSRQIAESAQRVSSVAEQTAGSARSGEGTVELTNDSIAGIRRQIDVVVAHMLDLGRKSQQIGTVLGIVSELAEQTNILAINATIEAAGAGESGKRFGVVADEIRKLADRVGGSTKEIRGLIDDVRSAVNTTVMATESGSKAVDLGAGHFVNAASAFKQIAGLVTTTTEAAREIELSTKQQATAVEQVTVAISSITQVSKESETSSLQTLQTASQLNQLSSDLLRLIRPQTAA
jgi:methyl-accepting chemotaxis protein